MTKPTVSFFPKFDLDAAMAVQKANVETMLRAHKIVSETTQAVAKLHTYWLKEAAGQTKALASAAVSKKPEAVLTDARGLTERAFAVARLELDLGIRAQSEVVDLLTKRAVANLDRLKALGAPAAAA